jgi:hypothetical protein
MYDFGLVELDGTVDLWWLTVPSTNVPTAPTGTPTFSIYEGDQDAPMTNGSGVSVTGPVNSQTGFYRKSHSIATSDGYERNKKYVVKLNYTISATSYSLLGFFTVV